MSLSEPPCEIIHLIDERSIGNCPAVLAMVADTIAHTSQYAHHLLLLGSPKLEAAAEAAGLHDYHTCRTLNAQGLTALLSPLCRKQLRRKNALFHCWSLQSLELITILQPDAPKCLTVTQHHPIRRGLSALFHRYLIKQAIRHDIRITFISHHLRRSFERAVSMQSDWPDQLGTIIPPALNAGRIVSDNRKSIRDSWRPVVTDTQPVIALISPKPAMANTWQAYFAVGLAQEAITEHDAADAGISLPLCLVVHPEQVRRAETEQYLVRQLQRPIRILQDARIASPWHILPACDIALCMADDHNTPHAFSHGNLPALWPLINGMPTIYYHAALQTDHCPICNMISNNRSAHFTTSLKSTAAVISELIMNRHYQTMEHDIKQDAITMFDPARYGSEIAAVYDELAHSLRQ